jgi:hypothetical protein
VKHTRDIFTIVVMVMGLMSLDEVASAQGLPPSQLPELTAEWWQWWLSMPSSVNPLTDTTGEQCMVGQRGPIWFLAGNLYETQAVTRSCSVPGDRTLFFPVINEVAISAPAGVCGSTGPGTAKQLRADIKPSIDAAQYLLVKVDGQPVRKNLLRRVQSQVFEIAIPADNVFGGGPSCPASIFSPAVDDGYYVSLDPLSLGAHTIHIQAESGSLTIDVTYNLTVVPVTVN